jgi:hypothetical protein
LTKAFQLCHCALEIGLGGIALNTFNMLDFCDIILVIPAVRLLTRAEPSPLRGRLER